VNVKAASRPVLAASADRRSRVLRPFLACGIDLMDVARFEREVARRGGGLVEELFGPAELAWCRRRRRACEGYAMAFAAKEALFKALGTGMVGRMTWNDIAIAWPEGAARPQMTLSGETAAVAAAMGVDGVHVAVAATREHAVAWVVVSGLGTRDPGFVCHAETGLLGDAAARPEPRIPNPESRH
jgi:holo-[acyl-carrier protein] synthase